MASRVKKQRKQRIKTHTKIKHAINSKTSSPTRKKSRIHTNRILKLFWHERRIPHEIRCVKNENQKKSKSTPMGKGDECACHADKETAFLQKFHIEEQTILRQISKVSRAATPDTVIKKIEAASTTFSACLH